MVGRFGRRCGIRISVGKLFEGGWWRLFFGVCFELDVCPAVG